MDTSAVFKKINALPGLWHDCGSISPKALRALIHHVEGMDLRHTVETGAGKSTLLFSHISPHHLVFSLNLGQSITACRDSNLINMDRIDFIEGPTQQTLPAHSFTHPFQVVLIDGPHGYPFPDLEYFYLYPHLETNGLLVIDDIDIPSIRNMFHVLRRDAMYTLLDVVRNTAFFRRTEAPCIDPFGDEWWEQGYNRSKLRKTLLAHRLNQCIPQGLGRWMRRKRGLGT